MAKETIIIFKLRTNIAVDVVRLYVYIHIYIYIILNTNI